jgi:hypothetical protein
MRKMDLSTLLQDSKLSSNLWWIRIQVSSFRNLRLKRGKILSMRSLLSR